MKKLFLFSTKLRYFWTLSPVVFLLVIAILYNNDVDSIFKLYPLIVVLSGVIVFMILYFFRAVIITHDDLKCIGVYSSKEYSPIKSGNTLVITRLKSTRALIELYGISDLPDFDWSKEEKHEINLFRARTNCNKRCIKKILTYYGFSEDDAENAINSDIYTSASEEAFLYTKTNELNECKQICIVFNDIPIKSET